LDDVRLHHDDNNDHTIGGCGCYRFFARKPIYGVYSLVANMPGGGAQRIDHLSNLKKKQDKSDGENNEKGWKAHSTVPHPRDQRQ